MPPTRSAIRMCGVSKSRPWTSASDGSTATRPAALPAGAGYGAGQRYDAATYGPGPGFNPSDLGAHADVVRAHLAHLAAALRPHVTGETYLNFLDLDGAGPDRIRAAYSSGDWDRLVRTKTAYDPDNVFRFNRNIPPAPEGGREPNQFEPTNRE